MKMCDLIWQVSSLLKKKNAAKPVILKHSMAYFPSHLVGDEKTNACTCNCMIHMALGKISNCQTDLKLCNANLYLDMFNI